MLRVAHQDPGCCCFLDQTKLASGRHCLAHLFSKCFCTSQLHPPGCPAEPSRASCLCPAPPEGISSCRQGEGWWLPFLFWLLPAEVHLLFLGILDGKLNGDSPVMGGGGPSPLGSPALGLPSHNLGTRQCLGHQMPASAWAHRQELALLGHSFECASPSLNSCHQ